VHRQTIYHYQYTSTDSVPKSNSKICYISTKKQVYYNPKSLTYELKSTFYVQSEHTACSEVQSMNRQWHMSFQIHRINQTQISCGSGDAIGSLVVYWICFIVRTWQFIKILLLNLLFGADNSPQTQPVRTINIYLRLVGAQSIQKLGDCKSNHVKWHSQQRITFIPLTLVKRTCTSDCFTLSIFRVINSAAFEYSIESTGFKFYSEKTAKSRKEHPSHKSLKSQVGLLVT